MKKPNVAILMSVYKSDSPENLIYAINSIVEQTYKNWNLFLCIDGPIPNDLNFVLEDCISKSKKITTLDNKVNLGLARSLNRLIDESIANAESYEYFFRMDSDDICEPYRIEKQISYMEKNKEVDVSGTYCREFGASFAIDKKLPTTHNEIKSLSFSKCPLVHPTVVFRRRLLSQGNRYPVNTHFTEDMAFWIELLEKGYKFGNLNEYLLHYRLEEATLRRRMGLKKGWSEFILRINYLKRSNNYNLLDYAKVSSRLLFHVLPEPILKILYKRLR